MDGSERYLGKHNINLVGGRFIHIYNTEEYTYGCSMTIDEWEDIKINIDSLINKSKEK